MFTLSFKRAVVILPFLFVCMFMVTSCEMTNENRTSSDAPVLDRIEAALPNETVYYNDDSFIDLDGLLVTAFYSNGSSQTVSDYTVTLSSLSLTEAVLTISFGSKTVTITIAVHEKNAPPVLEKIELTALPEKLIYNKGDAFSTEGMLVTAFYSNGDSEAVADYTYEPDGALNSSDTFITVFYEGKTAQLSITVRETADYFSNDFDESACSFFDKFDGNALDLNKWDHQNMADYWGDIQYPAYTAENVCVANGILTINAEYVNPKVNGKNYTSGRIVTANASKIAGTGIKFAQSYGRFEAKIRMNAGRGAWPVFSMMPVYSNYGAWPRSGEIDIMEMLGTRKTRSNSTLFMRGDMDSQYQGVESSFLDDSTFEDWHVFGCLWTPTAISFLVDGYETRTISRNWWNSSWYESNGFPSGINSYPPFNCDFFFIIDFALDFSTLDNGLRNNEAIPSYLLELDWIRAYTFEDDPWDPPVSYPAGLLSSYGN